METKPILAIVGATATGKTDLALRLAREVPLEVINADALQVYRGFDIGTAKPTPDQQAEVPHHLIDVLEPSERYSAGEFARRARQAIAEIRARDRLPVVVGGSGLYLRALLEGISPVPRGNRKTRQTLRRRLEEEGLEVLYRELARVDPEAAERLAPGDTQRILRALEVAEVSGVPLSDWIRRQPFGDRPLAAIRIGLTLPRPILYDRISSRVVRMLDRGWLDEVERLLERGLDPAFPAFQAIGYRQLVRYLEGQWSLDEAVQDVKKRTRRFAKRQETWFRKEPDIDWYNPITQKDVIIPRILEHLERSGPGSAYG